MLAGISVEYYTQLERGKVRGVSEDVLEAVARALQLDDIEHTHLFDLIRAAKQLAHPAPRETAAGARRRCSRCWTRSPTAPRSSATLAPTS